MLEQRTFLRSEYHASAEKAGSKAGLYSLRSVRSQMILLWRWICLLWRSGRDTFLHTLYFFDFYYDISSINFLKSKLESSICIPIKTVNEFESISSNIKNLWRACYKKRT